MASVVSVADRGTPSFQTARLSAGVVCAGDSRRLEQLWGGEGLSRDTMFPRNCDTKFRAVHN